MTHQIDPTRCPHVSYRDGQMTPTDEVACCPPVLCRGDQMSIHTATSTSKAQSIDNIIAQPPPVRTFSTNVKRSSQKEGLTSCALCFPGVTFYSPRSHRQCCPRRYPASHWPDCTLSRHSDPKRKEEGDRQETTFEAIPKTRGCR